MYTIYVPQNKCARLRKSTLKLDIDALYTDRIASCNIVVCIGEKQIILIHADNATVFPHVKKEIEWVEGNKEILLIFRESRGKDLHKKLAHFLNKNFKNSAKITSKSIDEQYAGIAVSFDTLSGSDIHKQVRKYKKGDRSLQLLHHPKEQKVFSLYGIAKNSF